MNKYESLLYGLVEGLVINKEHLSVSQMESLVKDEVLLFVHADEKDIARLIGKKGSTASAIRHLLIVAFGQEKLRFSIKFEAY